EFTRTDHRLVPSLAFRARTVWSANPTKTRSPSTVGAEPYVGGADGEKSQARFPVVSSRATTSTAPLDWSRRTAKALPPATDAVASLRHHQMPVDDGPGQHPFLRRDGEPPPHRQRRQRLSARHLPTMGGAALELEPRIGGAGGAQGGRRGERSRRRRRRGTRA